MPFDFFKYDYISINNFDGALHYPFVFDFKGINALLGAHTINVLLSGVSPLTLLNAVSLNYIKAFGKCEQASTPTPTSPVDIVCNNGTLKVRRQSGLPLEYQPYEYITTSGNKWLNTGVQLVSTDVVETEFKNNSSSGYGALYGVFAVGQSSAFYANDTYYGYDIANNKVNTGVAVDTAWHTLRQDFGNGIITLDGNDTTYTPFEFENVSDNCLFARYYNNSYGYGFKGSCKRFKVFRNGVLICDLIPVVRLSDNEVGMYDLVQNEFRGNIGGIGNFTATNPINDLEIYYDGTAETVQAHGKNLFTTTGETKDKSLNASGVEQNGIYENYQFNYTDYLPVLPNTEYTFSVRQVFNTTLLNHRIHEYTENKTWIKQGANLLTQSGGTIGGVVSVTFTTSATTKWLRINYVYNPAGENSQLELGSTATDYEPYFEGTTATCQPLLSVGDYKDVQNISNGAITRNVGVKVLDGTENWQDAASSSTIRYRVQLSDAVGGTSRSEVVSTHFSYISTGQAVGGAFLSTKYLYLIPEQTVATVADFKAFLASQYAAGTPVIVVYPLATPTTETVTGQTLTITQGTNIVTAVGSVSDLELEVSYKAYAEVTVEEIEAVNTDENVEVIIS